MTEPRGRARRNLAIFWIVLIGTPLLLVAACLATVGPLVQNP